MHQRGAGIIQAGTGTTSLFRSSAPFVGACDLGAIGVAARVDRRDPPVLLSELLSAIA